MGRMKDYMIDVMNAQRWVSRVHFLCPVCGELIDQEVDVPEPNYTAEKSRDMTVEGETEICCEECDNCFLGDVWAGPTHCNINLRDYDVEVMCDPPEYDRPPEDWLGEWEIPDHPKKVFDLNYSELQKIIEAQASEYGGSLMNRMIFAQIFTFLEAYFCDALIKGLRDNPNLLVEFAEKDGAISAASIPASAVLRDPNAVKNWIEKNLKDRLYHQFGSGKKNPKTGKENVEGVPLWYGKAFKFTLTPKDEDLDTLREYALLRHDCVHRNGETKDGEKLILFGKAYLLEALDTAKRIVDHIDGKIKNITSDQASP